MHALPRLRNWLAGRRNQEAMLDWMIDCPLMCRGKARLAPTSLERRSSLFASVVHCNPGLRCVGRGEGTAHTGKKKAPRDYP